MNQTELTDKLTGLVATVEKIKSETGSLIDLVSSLRAEIEAAGNVSQEVQDALGNLEAKLVSVDELVPDLSVVAEPEA